MPAITDRTTSESLKRCTITKVTREPGNYLFFWGVGHRQRKARVLFRVRADAIFDADGNYFLEAFQ